MEFMKLPPPPPPPGPPPRRSRKVRHSKNSIPLSRAQSMLEWFDNEGNNSKDGLKITKEVNLPWQPSFDSNAEDNMKILGRSSSTLFGENDSISNLKTRPSIMTAKTETSEDTVSTSGEKDFELIVKPIANCPSFPAELDDGTIISNDVWNTKSFDEGSVDCKATTEQQQLESQPMVIRHPDLPQNLTESENELGSELTIAKAVVRHHDLPQDPREADIKTPFDTEYNVFGSTTVDDETYATDDRDAETCTTYDRDGETYTTYDRDGETYATFETYERDDDTYLTYEKDDETYVTNKDAPPSPASRLMESFTSMFECREIDSSAFSSKKDSDNKNKPDDRTKNGSFEEKAQRTAVAMKEVYSEGLVAVGEFYQELKGDFSNYSEKMISEIKFQMENRKKKPQHSKEKQRMGFV